MKGELKLYCCLGILLIVGLLVQMFIMYDGDQPVSSEINELSTFDQLQVDMKCNIFLVEGEAQHFLVEGPEKILQEIETIRNENCIQIRKKSDQLLSGLLNFFKDQQNKITIYISVGDLDDIHVFTGHNTSLIKYSSDGMIGLSLKKGQSIIIESKKSKMNCV